MFANENGLWTENIGRCRERAGQGVKYSNWLMEERAGREEKRRGGVALWCVVVKGVEGIVNA